MKLLEKIKDYLGTVTLNKLLKKQTNRKASFCNINNAKSIGILFEINNESSYKQLLNFIKILREDYGIRKVKAIVFYQENESFSIPLTNQTFEYFTHSDLNWKREIKPEISKEFIDSNLDVLIDLTETFNIPLRNILIRSKSKLKIGRFSTQNQKYYDFMINSKHSNFGEFTKETLRYLTMINEK